MPKIIGGPKKLNNLLESVYSSCIIGGGSETSCSKQAWGAAKNAGWKKDKDGNWKKTQKVEKDKKPKEENCKKNFWNGVL